MAKLHNTVFGRNKVDLLAHNEIHKCIGGKVYTALPDNEIHSATAIYMYSSPKLRNEWPCLKFLPYTLRIYERLHALSPLDTPLLLCACYLHHLVE